MNIDLIPKVSSKEAELLHEKGKWQNFAQRIQRNPFVKTYIFKLYNGICPWCGLRLRKGINLQRFDIHHLDYMHQCIHDTFVEIPSPTEKRPNRILKIPDCQQCYSENPDAFTACTKRIVPVHKLCNAEIENKRQEN